MLAETHHPAIEEQAQWPRLYAQFRQTRQRSAGDVALPQQHPLVAAHRCAGEPAGERNKQRRHAVREFEEARRTALPPDFGPAPGGYCDEVVTERADPAGMLPAALADRLTPREAEIVALTLRGCPVADIAARLGISRGTVKNHRLAIYRKLDITTERELFGAFLAALGMPLG